MVDYPTTKMAKNINGEPMSWTQWKTYHDNHVRITRSSYSNSYSPAYSKINLGEVSLYFYSDELLAFRSKETGLLIAHSHGSSGRGLALNKINPDKKVRIDIRILNEKVQEYFESKGFNFQG